MAASANEGDENQAGDATDKIDAVKARVPVPQASEASGSIGRRAELKARKVAPRKALPITETGIVLPVGPVGEAMDDLAHKTNEAGSAGIEAAPVKPAPAVAPKRPASSPPATLGAVQPPTDTQPDIQNTSEQTKEETMSNPTNDYAETMNDAAGELQDRSKAAYEKSGEMLTEVTETTKGNVDAMVESGKIFSTGMQDIARAYVEEAKSAYEQMNADLKEMAAVKNPTELLQIQGKIMRRNFDAVVTTTSKNAEKMMKLSNDAFAPLSQRLNTAAERMNAEKMTKVG